MTGRTLVVPTMVCYCDWDEVPHVLDVCKIRGTDLRLPFDCPLDYLLATPHLDTSGLPYRMPGFLEHPQVRLQHMVSVHAALVSLCLRTVDLQVSMSMRRSRGAVEVVASKEAYEKQLLAAGAMGHAAVLWPGATQAEVEAAVAPFQSLAVLEVR